MWAAVRAADYRYLAPYVCILLAIHVVRTVRWGLLLRAGREGAVRAPQRGRGGRLHGAHAPPVPARRVRAAATSSRTGRGCAPRRRSPRSWSSGWRTGSSRGSCSSSRCSPCRTGRRASRSCAPAASWCAARSRRSLAFLVVAYRNRAPRGPPGGARARARSLAAARRARRGHARRLHPRAPGAARRGGASRLFFVLTAAYWVLNALGHERSWRSGSASISAPPRPARSSACSSSES